MALAEHLLGVNSINTLGKLWKQTGFRGTAATARQSEHSTEGTSGGTSIATRKWRQPLGVRRSRTCEGALSGFDWIAQLLRLRGSTALLVMPYMTNGLKTSKKMRELVNLIRECELPFVCKGDWNTTPEEMQKTELMGSTGAVIKTPPGGGVHLLLRKQTDGLRAG